MNRLGPSPSRQALPSGDSLQQGKQRQVPACRAAKLRLCRQSCRWRTFRRSSEGQRLGLLKRAPG